MHKWPLLLAVTLLGCLANPVAKRDSMFERARRSPATAVRDLQALERAYGLPIDHWADSTLADSLINAGHEGPCGAQQSLWVKRLLPVTPRYQLDKVIEFDDTAVVRTWTFPANEVPRGIRGQALLHVAIWFPDSVTLDSASLPMIEILPDGLLHVERLGGSLPEPAVIPCPPFAVEQGSDFWMCREFVDLSSHARRRLGYNGVCT